MRAPSTILLLLVLLPNDEDFLRWGEAHPTRLQRQHAIAGVATPAALLVQHIVVVIALAAVVEVGLAVERGVPVVIRVTVCALFIVQVILYAILER